MKRAATLLAAGGLLAGAFAAGGPDAFGRTALSLGAPGLAAALFEDPSWRGVAAHRAGDFAAAAAAFAEAGPGEAYNLGVAETRGANYAAALEAFDMAIAAAAARGARDEAALVNFDLVVAVYAAAGLDPDSIGRWSKEREGETVAAETARGDARAAGTGDEVTNTSATIGAPELEGGDLRRVRKVFDDKFVFASPRWLATLKDSPGAFLAARIAFERKRRAKAGEAPPPPASPW